MLSAPCPHCGATVNIRDDQAGKTVRCSKCQGRFFVKAPEDKPTEPVVESSHDLVRDDARVRRLAIMAVGIVALVVLLILSAFGHGNPASRLIADMVSTLADLIRLALLLAWVAAAIAGVAWVIHDARNRGDDNVALWAILVLATGVFGVAIYLSGRRKGELTTCERCQNRRLIYATVCPHCGIKSPT